MLQHSVMSHLILFLYLWIRPHLFWPQQLVSKQTSASIPRVLQTSDMYNLIKLGHLINWSYLDNLLPLINPSFTVWVYLFRGSICIARTEFTSIRRVNKFCENTLSVFPKYWKSFVPKVVRRCFRDWMTVSMTHLISQQIYAVGINVSLYWMVMMRR